MKRQKNVKELLYLLAMVCIGAIGTEIAAAAEDPNFTIRKIEEQTILYTIYRGDYNSIGGAVGNLFALAGKNGIKPVGQISYVYLNNPACISSKHWLTEIRIPVGKEALKFAGTLGEMTDVKALPAMEVVVAIKPEGVAEPSAIYDSLAEWIGKQGYAGFDSPIEFFLTNAMGGNYSQMKTEIMIPVKKRVDKK